MVNDDSDPDRPPARGEVAVPDSAGRVVVRRRDGEPRARGPAALLEAGEATFPTLRRFLRDWQRGRNLPNADGERVVVPWRLIVLRGVDYNDAICDEMPPPTPDNAVEAERQVDALADRLSDKMRQHATGYGERMRYKVTCIFHDPETGLRSEEIWTGSYSPPMLETGGGEPYMGTMAQMAHPSTWVALALRQATQDRMLSAAMVRTNADNLMEQLREARLIVAEYQKREMEIMALFRTLSDDAAKRQREDRRSEWRLTAMDALLKRLVSVLPIPFFKLNKWLGQKLLGDGTTQPTKEETSAVEVLRAFIEGAQKTGLAADGVGLSQLMERLGMTEAAQRKTFDLVEQMVLENMERGAVREALSSFGFRPVELEPTSANPTSAIGVEATKATANNEKDMP